MEVDLALQKNERKISESIVSERDGNLRRQGCQSRSGRHRARTTSCHRCSRSQHQSWRHRDPWAGPVVRKASQRQIPCRETRECPGKARGKKMNSAAPPQRQRGVDNDDRRQKIRDRNGKSHRHDPPSPGTLATRDDRKSGSNSRWRKTYPGSAEGVGVGCPSGQSKGGHVKAGLLTRLARL